jgi:hypothetical protein
VPCVTDLIEFDGCGQIIGRNRQGSQQQELKPFAESLRCKIGVLQLFCTRTSHLHFSSGSEDSGVDGELEGGMHFVPDESFPRACYTGWVVSSCMTRR